MANTPTPRADPTTPRVGFTLPSVGMDRDTWGGLTNGNWTLADTAIGGAIDAANAAQGGVNNLAAAIVAYLEPVGSIKVWPTNSPPTGWFACDGFAVSRTDWPDLFAVIGTSWGVGDGSTTFNIPNLQGATIVHRGGWMPFGGSQGETSHQLTIDEMPSHHHTGSTDPVGDHSHSYTVAATQTLPLAGGQYPEPIPSGQSGAQTGAAGGHSHTFQTADAGSSWGHNNIQPSVGMLVIIKALHYGF